jgi:alpha-tubulin suppressor-like RCC1 family protein
MSTFPTNPLLIRINDRLLYCINQNILEVAQVVGAANTIIKKNYTINCCSNLPDASNNKGRIVFVEDVKRHVFSDGCVWSNNFSLQYGTVWTWGKNDVGQLGIGTTTNRCSPGTTIGGGTTWRQVSMGYNHTLAIKIDGTLWSWGCNGNGQLGTGTKTSRSSPGTTAGGGTTWCQICASYSISSSIKTDGTLWTWGRNNNGQLGDGTTTDRSSPGTTTGGGTTWCQTSTGYKNTFGIKNDGTLWTWGQNNAGALGDGTTTNRCSPGTIAGGGVNWCHSGAGMYDGIAVKTDGTLWTWGYNTCGQLGDGTTTNRCSPGTTAGGGTTWCQATIWRREASAIKTDGTLWTWGRNNSGQLGDGTTTNRCSPGTTAGGGTTWCQIGSISYMLSAIKTDGTLWTWGCNNCGQLGDGTTTNRCSPGSTAGGGTTWCQISNNSDGTAGIRSYFTNAKNML